jgi:hypothetical protein
LLRARLSGEIHEYMANAKPIHSTLQLTESLDGLRAAQKQWLSWYQHKVCNLPQIKRRLAK